MESTSAQIRAEKKIKREPFNIAKQKFLQKHEDFTDRQLLKEHLFEHNIQSSFLKEINNSLKLIKWIVLISFIVSILLGIYIGFLS